MSLRTVFFGTPEFALPTLQALIDDNEIEVTGVVTQPDRPAGRGNRLRPSPVKELALAHQLDILQPVKLKDPEVVPWLQRQYAHVYVVVAYGGFIPRTIRELTPWGCINLHPSLLPKYRGAAPIQWAIMNGDTHTGNSTMYLSSGWDDGDVIYQEVEPVHPDDSYGTLAPRLAEKGAALVIKSLKDVAAGTAPRIPQPEEGIVMAPMIANEDAQINWNRSAPEIHNQVRGLNPVPGAFTIIEGERVKVYKTEIVPMEYKSAMPGEIISTEFNTLGSLP